RVERVRADAELLRAILLHVERHAGVRPEQRHAARVTDAGVLARARAGIARARQEIREARRGEAKGEGGRCGGAEDAREAQGRAPRMTARAAVASSPLSCVAAGAPAAKEGGR